MRTFRLVTVFAIPSLLAFPAHAAVGGPVVPEIGATGTLPALAVVAAIVAIIVERRRK